MQMVSPEHCVVNLVYDHPVLGSLDVDRFQRTQKACEEFKATGLILWQGLNLKVDRVHVATRKEVPQLSCPAHYTVIVKDPVAL